MKLVPSQFGPVVAGLLLITATGRLVRMCRDELRLRASAAQVPTTLPHRSTLKGIGPSGHIVEPLVSTHGILMFPVRATEIAKDVEYWNRAVDELSSAQLSIDCWGVCDSGRGCDVAVTTARFALLGFLDPLQMHVLAAVKSRGDALLYDSTGIFRGVVKREPNPSDTVATVRKRENR